MRARLTLIVRVMERSAFGLYFAVYASIVSAGVVITAIVVNQDLAPNEIARISIWIGIPVVVSAWLAAQPYYNSATRVLDSNNVPWKQCIGVVLLSYPLCGLFMNILGVALYPNNFSFRPADDFIGGVIMWTIMPFLVTFWATIPIGLLIARQISYSNNSLNTDAPR